MTFLLSLFLACQLFTLRKVFCIKNLASPIYVVVYVYITTAIVGYTLYSFYPKFSSFGYTSLEILLKPEENVLTLEYFLSFINTILLGSLLFISISRSRKIRNNKLVDSNGFAPKKNNSYYELVKKVPKEPINLSKPLPIKLKPGILTLLCIIPTIILIIGVGPEKILLKDNYLEINNRFMVSIGNIFLLPASLGIGYNLANKVGLVNRFTCYILIISNFLIFFSLATRYLSILPIMITCGYWFNSKKNKLIGVLLATLSVIIFSPLIYLSIFLRGQSEHGFLPYIKNVGELSPEVIFTAPLGFLSNFLFSFPLTGEVIKQRSTTDYPIDYLIISLNPLQGDFAGWYEINNKLRLNEATPFNTIAEMYLYGNLTCFLMFFFLGIILMFITSVFHKNLKRGRIVYAMLLFVLILLFVFSSLQYNLRSSTRLLYLAFVLSVFFNKKQIVPKN